MAYRAEIDRAVQKTLARFPRRDQARVLVTIKDLATEPRPAGCEPVKSAAAHTYRVRVGDYRVVYTILDEEQIIVVARVVKRSESTYRDL